MKITTITVREITDDQLDEYLTTLESIGYPKQMLGAIEEYGIGVWNQPELKVKTTIEVEKDGQAT